MNFLGVDVGASATKGVLIDDKKKVLSSHVVPSGTDFKKAAEDARAGCLKAADGETVARTLATGYGRRNVPFADDIRTEISCHAKGGHFHYKKAGTIVDIGGQDSKVISVDDAGKPASFKMNRKCAAGTGAFLEEIALRLSVPLGEMDALARKAGGEIELGSYCTVFTKTEILARIAEGAKVEDLAKGAFGCVVRRVLEMAPLSGGVALTGGVIAHNPHLGEMFAKRLGREPFIPPLPQFAGALGAALFALESPGG